MRWSNPGASLALAALLAGCGSAAPVVPVVVIAPPAEAAAEPTPSEPAPAEEAVPFVGTYPRYTVVSFKDGEVLETLNASGTASLKIERGKVTYEQRYTKYGHERRVTQVYTFKLGDVRRAHGAYDIPLAYQSIDGDVADYFPDSGSPRLAVRKQPWGWQAVLMAADTSNVVAGAAFGAAPPNQPAPDLEDYARRLGVPPP